MKASISTVYWRNKTSKLEKQLDEANKRIEQLEGEVEAFWTGIIPEGASLSQVVLARWGRQRIESINKNLPTNNIDIEVQYVKASST